MRRAKFLGVLLILGSPLLPSATSARDSQATMTPTPTLLPACEVLDVGETSFQVGEGDINVCSSVKVEGDCCWRSSVTGDGARLTSPDLQCGDGVVCVYIHSCNCSACSWAFKVNVSNRTLQGLCRNYTPTATSSRIIIPATPSPSPGLPDTATPTPTAIPTPSATATHLLKACIGDCDGDGELTIDELVVGVNLALGNRPLAECPSFDADGSGSVTVTELIEAILYNLEGCS